jgi:hypothetical protein
VTTEIVTRDEAVEIATKARHGSGWVLPDRCTQAVRVTDEPPPGLGYESSLLGPAWYVWFRPNSQGVASSEVIVVSKGTGQIVGAGSAGDEG